MKKITLFIAFLALTMSFKQLSAQTKVEDVLQFKNDQYNFGKISFGKPATYTIEITNISKDTITLVTARPGCGCTIPNFKSNQKMGPGQMAEVQITFNGNVMGLFTRFTDLEFSGGLKKQTKFSGEGVAISNNTSTSPIITNSITNH
jgi:hypothetical protein